MSQPERFDAVVKVRACNQFSLVENALSTDLANIVSSACADRATGHERATTCGGQQPLRIASQDLKIRAALNCRRHVTPGSKRRDRPRSLRDAA